MDVKRERFEGNAASGQGETRADPREVGALVSESEPWVPLIADPEAPSALAWSTHPSTRSRAEGSMSGPIDLFASVGSPMVRFSATHAVFQVS
jgi:hypothetical protein